MIGLVVVSHSAALAAAAVDLAVAMVPGERPAIAVAAGTPEGLGTDAMAVFEAITQVASPEGVLVFMDLGSALLSTEMALEFLGEVDYPVRLTSAPFVEGLLAGVVTAASGASLSAVAREAEGALAAKRGHLGAEAESEAPQASGAREAAADLTVSLPNPLGLHARPAALIMGALTGLDAEVFVSAQADDPEPAEVTGPISLLVLGARQSETLHFWADGPDAREALEKIEALVADGFGEV